ncbi:autophagy-related protein 2 homolog A-like [Stegodyphus dumicola]|uniref:autophagy-related protein 2 homolog A-like n=1 Tax=Stegodyphus dumicola TaxID=202533 RepID=UPI0015A86069|nr:autophagy-related protein 2 homolog A-like [Stegodyphus dumicola]
MERVPWWQQNLHKEILIMVMKDVTFATTVDGALFQTRYEIQCRDFHGLFALSETEKPISFVRVSVDPDVDEVSRENGFDWPRLVITKVTKLSTGDLESALDDHEEVCAYSLSDVLISNLDNEPSPFCSTSVADGSKLYSRNKNLEENKKNSDHDEIVKPANKETILNFLEQIVNKSEYLLEFTLPTINMILHDKEFFELLSNRLCSDLLLWENASLAPAATYDPNRFKVHAPGLDLDVHMTKDSAYDQYPVFKPFSNDSNSDSDEEEAAYCSVFEYCQRQQQKHKRKTNDDMFTKISVSLVITKGMLTVNTPALDADNKVMPEYCGKLQLHVEDGQLFIASSYKGDPNESYLCFLAEKSSLYHKGAVLQDVDTPVVQSFSSTIQSNLNRIIYESEPGMLLKSNCDSQNIRDMLKVAVHTVRNPKQQIKTFKVAMDISSATLRHHTYPVQQLWINQFIDFLKINDYPINGYVPPAIVTELHINLSNCAIDYRPLKLPLRTAVTVDNFNMSCNVTATTPSFLFRIISEEMRLFISNYVAAKKVELRKNYVCVIDTGLIDISFRTNVDEKNDPKLEMCATNDKVHIWTCADSFKALMELMVYLSNNGDMDIFTHEENEVIQDIKELSKSINTETETKDVHLLMAEAMKECSQAKISGSIFLNRQ